ncbi:MAG: YjbQ family protein [Candidatus Erginobacter occultus]|nr:YjbQ family protein [Candidatus Erginobacter occultus]
MLSFPHTATIIPIRFLAEAVFNGQVVTEPKSDFPSMGPAPGKPYSRYHHNGFDDIVDAHLKRQIMRREAVMAITEGRLDFGPWVQIFYGEFDGGRKKQVLVKIIGEQYPTRTHRLLP